MTDTAAAAAAVGGAGRLAAQAVSPTAALGYYLLPGYQAPYSTGTSSKVTCYFASAAVTVDSSHMIASSSASWSRFSPTSNFVNFCQFCLHADNVLHGLLLATITGR